MRDVLAAQRGIYAREEGAADLYAGIPFCPSKCNYCSFITADITRTGKFVDGYLTALEGEIAACRGLFSRLRSAYVGGGTPLVLERGQLERVLRALAPLIPAGTEYTVEAGRPDVFTSEKLDLLRAYGVTRICVNRRASATQRSRASAGGTPPKIFTAPMRWRAGTGSTSTSTSSRG